MSKKKREEAVYPEPIEHLTLGEDEEEQP